jgi:hypothetical protein
MAQMLLDLLSSGIPGNKDFRSRSQEKNERKETGFGKDKEEDREEFWESGSEKLKSSVLKREGNPLLFLFDFRAFLA